MNDSIKLRNALISFYKDIENNPFSRQKQKPNKRR